MHFGRELYPPPPHDERSIFFFRHWGPPRQAPAKTAHATVLGARGSPECAVVSPMARCSL